MPIPIFLPALSSQSRDKLTDAVTTSTRSRNAQGQGLILFVRFAGSGTELTGTNRFLLPHRAGRPVSAPPRQILAAPSAPWCSPRLPASRSTCSRGGRCAQRDLGWVFGLRARSDFGSLPQVARKALPDGRPPVGRFPKLAEMHVPTGDACNPLFRRRSPDPQLYSGLCSAPCRCGHVGTNYHSRFGGKIPCETDHGGIAAFRENATRRSTSNPKLICKSRYSGLAFSLF